MYKVWGGYHAAEINEQTHNLFEEIPSLGISGDLVMALCQEGDNPTPNYRVRKPTGTIFNTNLTGNVSRIGGPRRPEILQKLAGTQGITATRFPEYLEGTRFNLKYLRSISDILGKFETFRTEKICFSRLTRYGGETQVI